MMLSSISNFLVYGFFSLLIVSCNYKCDKKYDKIQNSLHTLKARKSLPGFSVRSSFYLRPNDKLVLDLKDTETYEVRIYDYYGTDLFVRHKVYINLRSYDTLVSSKLNNKYFSGVKVSPNQSGKFVLEIMQDSRFKTLCYNVMVFARKK